MSSTTGDHDPVIHLAIELSCSRWLVAARLPGDQKPRLHRIVGGDSAALLALVSALRARVAARLGTPIGVVCCFEAGRDGFWLYRLLTVHGVVSHVLEPTSILVNRRARRAKTDRLDVEGMLRVLAAYLRGDRQACSMVHVPTPEEEDANRHAPRTRAPGAGAVAHREPHRGPAVHPGHPAEALAAFLGA